MLVKDIGGEFALIKKLLPASGTGASLLLSNGDDAAVVRSPAGGLVATVDSIVEGKHFSFDYFSPKQIGIRAIEGATSDIAAVGGLPRFVLCALILPKRTKVKTIQEIYHGISSSLSRIGAVLIGGDTSSGSEALSVSITVIGEIPKGGKIMSRAGAKPGDVLMVTGGLGGSAAGLALLRARARGHERVKKYHLEPRCRIDIGRKIARYAHAGIDISDGLSSEIHHLCRASSCGAVIDAELLPMKYGVLEAANALDTDPFDWMLNGGEEYELLYAAPKSKASKLPGIVIGEISSRRKILLRSGNKIGALPAKGFVHLR